MPFYPFLGEGSPTKIDYRRKKKKGTLILASVLEDIVGIYWGIESFPGFLNAAKWILQ